MKTCEGIMRRFLVWVSLGALLLLSLAESASAYTFTVSGTIDMQFQTETSDYRAMKQIKVEIWDVDILFDDKVADTNTDDNGDYSALLHLIEGRLGK